MSSYRFEVGSVVSLTTEGPLSRQHSRYVVEAQMPPLGTSPQYRIKAESEGFRRVVVEDQLSSFGAEQTPSPPQRADKPHSGEAD